MTADAGRRGEDRAARRPGRTVAVTALAVVLVVTGAAALVVGLVGRDAEAPPAVPAGGIAAPRPAPDALPTEPAPTTAAPTAPASPVAPSARTSTAPSAIRAPDPAAAPVAVRIPTIDVDSDLLHLGLQPDGRLAVPEGPDFDTAAWFDGSPRPGDVGPAVLLGHVSSRARGPSVFHDLGDLRPGDRVDVERADGTTATFEVYELQQFPKDSFPTLAVYGNTAGPELRLITCGGTIAESTGRFEDNVVVFARQV
ncbi:class F sortase [Aquipuribacter nitratireducens]|uniref:Class F sortase n=1 Tax=Aquipuribacter nitratireducens TaxID=650104 RepID=A0ABW0GPX2_9MICO